MTHLDYSTSGSLALIPGGGETTPDRAELSLIAQAAAEHGGIVCNCDIPTPIGPAGICDECGVEGPKRQEIIRAFEIQTANGTKISAADEEPKFRFTKGSCLLTMPKMPPAIWGDGSDIIWAAGQSLIIAGHDGTGKTTFAGNLVRARLGITSQLLGLTVTPSGRNILYLAMDRPMQAKSNLARMFGPEDKEILDRLIFWEGPPPEDFARNTKLLAEMCAEADADTCIVDSLKDACVPISEDGVGAGWNRARQEVLVAGTQLLELHHPRKPGGEQSADKEPELADLYGSRWIAAGAGSVIILHGRAGDGVVKMLHRKPIINPVGPWKIDYADDGTATLDSPPDLLAEIRSRGVNGLTATEAAQFLYGSASEADVKRAKRELKKLEDRQRVLAQTGGGRGSSSRWFLLAEDVAA